MSKEYQHPKHKTNENWKIIDPKTPVKDLIKNVVELPSINQKVLETLCSYHCTKKEICDVLEVDSKQLNAFVKGQYSKKWDAFYSQFSAKGKAKIRENMMKLSANSPEMAKELKKEYLQGDSKETLKLKVGRPAMFKTPKELQERVDKYFDECQNSTPSKPFTMTGLTLAIGFSSRQSLLDYQGKEEFMDIIKRAKTRVEAFYEESLHSGQVVAGIIFGLKANFKWKDTSTIETQNLDKDGKPADLPAQTTIINKSYFAKDVSTDDRPAA